MATPGAEAAQLSTVSDTVLVVDDEKNIRRTLEMVLGGEGYRVLEATNAETGLEMVGNPEQPVELVVLDLKLPGIDGIEALSRLRADEATRDMPVIVISGHATVDDALLAALSGKYAMQITMDFVRDIDAEKIQKAYREGFEKHASEPEWAEIEPLVERFVGYFDHEVKKYDQYVLRSLPGGVILATIRGIEGGPIENATFARVLWRIWLAKGSVVDRKDLVRMAVEEEDED